MSLLTEKLDELSRQYAADVAALKCAKESIEAHEHVGELYGLTPIVSVHNGQAWIWLHNSSVLVSNSTLSSPVRFIAGKPVYNFMYEGHIIHVLGE